MRPRRPSIGRPRPRLYAWPPIEPGSPPDICLSEVVRDPCAIIFSVVQNHSCFGLDVLADVTRGVIGEVESDQGIVAQSNRQRLGRSIDVGYGGLDSRQPAVADSIDFHCRFRIAIL